MMLQQTLPKLQQKTQIQPEGLQAWEGGTPYGKLPV